LGKELKVHRRSVYDVVERLVEKGVLGYIERDKKKFYYPITSKIANMIKEKKRED
jgi:sugar-specific transcriptional regulator TrmB